MKKYFLFVILSLIGIGQLFSQRADLSLELSVNENLVAIGETVIFTIDLTNDGPDETTGIRIRNRLPSAFEFERASSNLGIFAPVDGIWIIGGLPSGGTAQLQLYAKALQEGNHINLAEVITSDILDIDSSPGNGVDTDGDGNALDDPGDEDDGDGQLVIVSRGSTTSGSPPTGGTASGRGDCLVPMDALSSMTPNPAAIDGTFKFDYKIKALMNFEMADTEGFSPEYFRGNPNEFIMEYYVNSADGSILFPGGEMGFFNTNFKDFSAFGEIHAAIWRPNGQMVVYGIDARNGTKQAITRESIQTAEGRYQNDFLQIQRFISSSLEWGEWREPLPARIDWSGDVIGYKADLIEAQTGLTNIWIIYFDKAPTPIITSVPMMGFMVGVLKDIQELQCNRLAVYTKVHIGGYDSGDAIEMELKWINPMGITFDGSLYKPITLGGDYGTAGFEKMDDFENKLRRIEISLQILKQQRKKCRNDRCYDRIDAQLEELQKQKSEVICKQMVELGMEDSFAECMRKELEGY